MSSEAEDNWFVVADRFAASSLRIIFVGQTAAVCCWRILLFSAKGFAISWCWMQTSLSYFVAGRCFQVIPLITLWLFMFCHNYFIFFATKRFLSAVEFKCIRVASSKVLALISLIPYLGKITLRASDWTAAPAKTPEHGSEHKRAS